ncbi:MAG: hypothetical protein V4636_13000 [Pseudomonadota bacterium]
MRAMSDIPITATIRGFAMGKFTDANGVECSIQKSSSAMEDLIWLGADEIGLKRFEPGIGWTDVPVERTSGGITHVANTRMHLTRENVAALLPLLQHFADTGELSPETAGT